MTTVNEIKGIKRSVSEANRCNSWAIILDTKDGAAYCQELISDTDEPAINPVEVLVMKSNAHRKSTTIAEVKEAINNISFTF